MTRNKNPPPACNTGVEKPILSQNIHWLEVTFKSEAHKKLPESLPQEGIECYPLHGYNTGLKFSDGRMEFMHTNRPDMGVHVQWDGTSLTRAETGPLTLLSFLSQTEARFTRIDLAVDCRNFNLKAEDATNEILTEIRERKAKDRKSVV